MRGTVLVAALTLSAGGAAAQAAPVARVEVGAATEAGTEVRVTVPAPLVSYQGEVRFDPASARFVSAAFPAGVTGAAHEVEPGRVRFAAVAPAGTAGGPVLRLTVRPLDATPPGADRFRVLLEEAVGLR